MDGSSARTDCRKAVTLGVPSSLGVEVKGQEEDSLCHRLYCVPTEDLLMF